MRFVELFCDEKYNLISTIVSLPYFPGANESPIASGLRDRFLINKRVELSL